MSKCEGDLDLRARGRLMTTRRARGDDCCAEEEESRKRIRKPSLATSVVDE